MRLLVILIFIFLQRAGFAQQVRVAELFTLFNLPLESAKAKAVEMGFTFRPLNASGELKSVFLDGRKDAWVNEKGQQYAFEYRRSPEFLLLDADTEMIGVSHVSVFQPMFDSADVYQFISEKNLIQHGSPGEFMYYDQQKSYVLHVHRGVVGDGSLIIMLVRKGFNDIFPLLVENQKGRKKSRKKK